MPVYIWIPLGILTAAYACLMLWYWVGWSNTPLTTVSASYVPKTRISIIIAARNEEANIGACLKSILLQTYPKDLFEIIVVDDHSTDATVAVANRFGQIKTIAQNDGQQGKKKAIETGIRIATGTLIVTTDADCMVTPDWLLTIASYYEEHQPAMIAAPVYFSQVKGVLGIWQLLDFGALMAITAASIENGLPQMCNGANLSYEKAAFEKVGGFTGIDGLPTGDDVLLMMKIHQQYPKKIDFLKSPSAIVRTSPQPDFPSLFAQRLRWVSKSKVFPDWRVTAILVLAYFFNLSILAVFFSSIWHPANFMIGMIIISFKTLLELPLLFGSLHLSRQRNYLLQLPWVMFLHIIYVVAIGPLSLIGGYRWKGRCY